MKTKKILIEPIKSIDEINPKDLCPYMVEDLANKKIICLVTKFDCKIVSIWWQFQITMSPNRCAVGKIEMENTHSPYYIDILL